MSEAAIRPLRELDELRACVRLQEATWGEGFAERVPASILKVVDRLGGLTAGAWDGERLVGFVFGLTGLEAGEPVHWSDMLAVAPGHRDRGLGRRLKAFQRGHCLAQGVTVCRWSFDPLEARNAWLNLGVLGAVCREYARDMYGAAASPLHEGIGTDRLVTLWRMDAPRVAHRLDGSERPPGPEVASGLPRAFPVEATGGLPAPGPVALPDAPRFLVPLPRSIQEVKAWDPALARAWRQATRDVLEPALGNGWEVRELLRLPEGPCYLLTRTEEEG